MPKPFRLKIVTLEREVYSQDVASVVVPGTAGEMTILADHAPLISTLGDGVVTIIEPDGERFVAVSGGFIEVKDKEVVLLPDLAERSEEIDVVKAEEAKRRAEEILAKREALTEEQIQARRILERTLIELRAHELMKRRRKV
ncbi:MAG: ATP synthase F1 subunit epsilon [Parcubacteria group bacterium]|nr:ATP synthase F1 subunit epsilon [Parcubacteria group bacterium]